MALLARELEDDVCEDRDDEDTAKDRLKFAQDQRRASENGAKGREGGGERNVQGLLGRRTPEPFCGSRWLAGGIGRGRSPSWRKQ